MSTYLVHSECLPCVTGFGLNIFRANNNRPDQLDNNGYRMRVLLNFLCFDYIDKYYKGQM